MNPTMHQMVLLKKARPAEGLSADALGTIVHIYVDGRACEVEFEGPKVVTLSSNAIRAVLGEAK